RSPQRRLACRQGTAPPSALGPTSRNGAPERRSGSPLLTLRRGVPVAEHAPHLVLLLHREVRADQLHALALECLRHGCDRGILAQQHQSRRSRRHLAFHRVERRVVDVAVRDLLGDRRERAALAGDVHVRQRRPRVARPAEHRGILDVDLVLLIQPHEPEDRVVGALSAAEPPRRQCGHRWAPYPPDFPVARSVPQGSGRTPDRSRRWSAAAAAVTGGLVRGVAWWGVVSSAAAPVLMLTGWTVAAAL